jgi:hypothetical protein
MMAQYEARAINITLAGWPELIEPLQCSQRRTYLVNPTSGLLRTRYKANAVVLPTSYGGLEIVWRQRTFH